MPRKIKKRSTFRRTGQGRSGELNRMHRQIAKASSSKQSKMKGYVK